MKRNEETSLWTGIGFLIAFLLWTALIRCTDWLGITSTTLLVMKTFGIMKLR